MTAPPLARLRLLLSRRGGTVAVALAVVGVVLVGAGAWTYATPPTTRVTDYEHRQTVTLDLHTSATATGDTSLYAAGARLEDQPLYLYESAPTVRVDAALGVEGGELRERSLSVRLVYRVVRGGETFWRESHTVAAATDPDSSAEGSVDPRAVRERARRLADDVGEAATVRVELVAAASYRTGLYEGNVTARTPVEWGKTWYAVPPASEAARHRTPVGHTVTVPRSPLGYAGPAGAGVLALVGAAVVVVVGRRTNERRLEHRVHERRYAEWISTGTVPDPPADRTVDVATLADLAELAIDTRKRVVHDPETDTYFVVDGEVAYRFRRGATLDDVWD